MRISVCRKEHFNAAHRLYNPGWDDEKNDAIFGKCNNPNFHGHNYELHVRLIGEPDPDTGYVYDLKRLKDIIRKYVIDKLDHKNLNLDVPFMAGKAVVIYDILRKRIEKDYDIKITLYETERNYVEYPA